MVSAASAKDKQQEDSEQPVAFGMLTHPSGCVIFKEYRKTTGKFYGVAVATKTVGQLEVVESRDYSLDKKLWKEDQEGVNELQKIAEKDKVKFVKIPNKNPTQDQLETARDMCKGAAEAE
jgi:hypothetical protein